VIAEPWPTELAYDADAKVLRVVFEGGQQFDLAAEYLRVESPSAEVQGHNPSERVIVGERAHVGIMNFETVGNYAVRIIFDDLHDTGIYSWRYLYDLGREYPERWRAYIEALKAKGLSRHPKAR